MEEKDNNLEKNVNQDVENINVEIMDEVLNDEDTTNDESVSLPTNEITIAKSDFTQFDEILKQKEMKANKKRIKKNKAIRGVNNLIDVVTFLRVMLICVITGLLLMTFLVNPFVVGDTGMNLTVHDGDLGLSNIISYKLTGVNRFDIVVVYDEKSNKNVIRRIVGLPNETIAYLENVLYIDNAKIDEAFFDEEYRSEVMMLTNEYFTKDFSEVVLGDDEYFVMGDNRPYSVDSREFGSIKKDKIISKDFFVLFPFERLGNRK